MTKTTLSKLQSLVRLSGKNRESYPRPTVISEGDSLSGYVDRVSASGDEATRLILAKTLAELPSEVKILNPRSWISKLTK